MGGSSLVLGDGGPPHRRPVASFASPASVLLGAPRRHPDCGRPRAGNAPGELQLRLRARGRSEAFSTPRPCRRSAARWPALVQVPVPGGRCSFVLTNQQKLLTRRLASTRGRMRWRRRARACGRWPRARWRRRCLYCKSRRRARPCRRWLRAEMEPATSLVEVTAAYSAV
jgi:hypothetical protein